MAIIGIFTLAADGKLTGSLKTLTLSTKLQFVPETNKTKDSAPDLRIYLDKSEVGAAWKKVGRESGREYWSVKLDVPPSPHRSLPAWSIPTTARPSIYCGHAATATDHPTKGAPPAAVGR